MGLGLEPINWDAGIDIYGTSIYSLMTQEERNQYYLLMEPQDGITTEKLKDAKNNILSQVLIRYIENINKEVTYILDNIPKLDNRTSTLLTLSNFLLKNENISKLAILTALQRQRQLAKITEVTLERVGKERNKIKKDRVEIAIKAAQASHEASIKAKDDVFKEWGTGKYINRTLCAEAMGAKHPEWVGQVRSWLQGIPNPDPSTGWKHQNRPRNSSTKRMT